jgi:hypothetical protein
LGNEELLIWHIALLVGSAGSSQGKTLNHCCRPTYFRTSERNPGKSPFFFFLFGSSIYPLSGLFLVKPWYPPDSLLPELSQSRSKGGRRGSVPQGTHASRERPLPQVDVTGRHTDQVDAYRGENERAAGITVSSRVRIT